MSATTRGRADWTNRTVSDWLDMTPSDWMDQAMPGWRDWSYGSLLQARPSDWWGMMTGASAGPAAPPSTRPGLRPRPQLRHDRHHWDCACDEHREHGHRRHHHHHECGHCGPDPCECFCCIGDVDFAVYSRVGEERVLPVVIENERRREQEVTLELSDWTTRGGRAAPVETVLLEPKSLTLAPCGRQHVALVVKINPDAATGDTSESSKAAGAPGTTSASQQTLTDVDGCEIATADLRLVGCDHRPIRLALAILSRHCDPLRVPCGCACC